MPQLTRDAAKKAEGKAEKLDENGFARLDPGFYLFRLLEVNEKTSKAGNEMWVWKFESVVDEIVMFHNTLTTDQHIGRLGKVFEAFGVPADTDTDLLCGKLIAATVVMQKNNETGIEQPSMTGLVPAASHPSYKGAGAGAAKSTADYGLSEEASVKPKSSKAQGAFDPDSEPF